MYQVNLTQSYFPAQHDDDVQETTVGGILRAQALKTPNAGALVEAGMDGAIGRSWSYNDLLRDSERLAHALLTRFKPGERICVWAPNIPEWVILEYGAALAGLTLVTANPGYKPRELKYVLEQSRSVGLFLVRAYRGNPMAQIATEISPQLPALREIVDMEDAAAFYAGADAKPTLPDVRPSDPVQIQYTSGTTGFPKGAVLHHCGVTNNARFCFARMNSPRGETVLNFMPMFHTAGCGLITLGAAQFGGRMIIAKLFDPEKMLDLFESERVNSLLGVPTMLTALCEAQAKAPRDTSALRIATSGGSMVAPELVRRVRSLFGCEMQPLYGQTESSPLLTQCRSELDIIDLCETVGQAMPQTELSIRDPHTNEVVPVGAVGEICARGYCVMIGYNDNPEANEKAIDSEGWLHTGDLGTMDARGFVKITGRVKEMIIRGGENLFPAEIENVLLEHPDVVQVAVVGAPDDKWGEIVICFVQLRNPGALDKPALISHCREHLAAQKTPAQWIEIKEWPLTGSGKIQKFVLRDRFMDGEFKT